MNAILKTRRAVLYATLCAALAAGCGGGGGVTAPPPTVADSLGDLGELLKLLADQRQKPPGKQAEIDQYEPTAMHAVAALKAKEIVYFWGAGLIPGGNAVVAYYAKADTDGGPVLLQDGTVKTMTAAEFAAAPKAGKK